MIEIHAVSVVFDCADPERLVDWWHELTGWEVSARDPEWSALRRPDRSSLGFQKVPEPKVVKNRVHVDLVVGDEEAAAAEAQERLVTTFLWRSEDPEDPFVVLADPEGNEFCFVRGTGTGSEPSPAARPSP